MRKFGGFSEGSKFSVSWGSEDKARSMGYKTLPSGAYLGLEI
jgi:hypothetical protein